MTDLRPEDLDGLTSWTLIRAAHHVERELTALFAEFGLSPSQFGVLAYLAAGEPLTQADLARLVLVRPQSIADVIEGMVQRDLLVRTGQRGRGRRNPVTLSVHGSHVLEAAWEAVLASDQRSSTKLAAAEREQLNDMLHLVLGTRRPWLDPGEEWSDHSRDE